jgi:hypothetical protein
MIVLLVQTSCGWAVCAARAQESPESQPAGDAEMLPAGAPALPPPRGGFRLDVADLYLGAEMDYQSRRVRYSSPSWRENRTHQNRDFRMTELFGIGMAGDVIDPALIDWRAGMEFGLTQSRFKEEIDAFSRSDDDHGTLLEYDLNVDLFKTKPVSLNAFARRSDDRIGRRFLPSLRETSSEAGVSALAVTGPVTTEFGLSWRDVERHGNRLEEDDEELETARAWIDSKWEIAENHRFRLAYEHEDQGSNYQGSLYNFDVKRDELRLEHELGFGQDDRHRLDTFIRYNEESGDLERDELQFVPRLTLQHTDNFRTVYRYGYYGIEQGALEIDQHKFDIQALYTPTKSLRLGLDGYMLFEHANDNVDTTEGGAGFDTGYTRPTRYGEFNANLNLGYDRAETSGPAGRRFVRAEGHRLDDVRPVFLQNRHVIIQTLIAHSENYTRVYIPGQDYLIIPVADRIMLKRVPWGRIGPLDVVYFDYLYEVPADSAVDSVRTDLLLEHRFTFGLTPYYAFEGRFQNIDESSFGTPVYRDNQDRHRIGARYGKNFWSVGAEYEIFDDSIEPYDAWHFTGQAALLRTTAHSLDLNGEVSRYAFEGGLDRRRVWWFDLDLRDTIRIRDDFSLKTAVAYHREDDSVDGMTDGVDLEMGFQYVRGYLTVELTLEYDLLAIAQNREQGFGVFLNVRRDLSHLLPARRDQR